MTHSPSLFWLQCKPDILIRSECADYIQITPCTVKDAECFSCWNLTGKQWTAESVSKVDIHSVHNSFYFCHVVYFWSKQPIQINHLAWDFKITLNACKKNTHTVYLHKQRVHWFWPRRPKQRKVVQHIWFWQRFLCFKALWDPNDVTELVKTILNSTDEENSARNKHK